MLKLVSLKRPLFCAIKGWFKILNRLLLHFVKITGEIPSADHEAASSYPNTFYKIITEKGYITDEIFNAYEIGLFWKKMPS